LSSVVLLLIRDNYQAAERAIFYLEEHAGILGTAGLTNLRDVLSHLSSMLEENTPEDKRDAQLASAEEHLRRAIFDPYAVALRRLRGAYRTVLADYRKYVLPFRSKNSYFKKAPDEGDIRARWEEVVRLAQQGRAAKGRNLWDRRWEEGVSCYIQAYDRLSKLHADLLGYCNHHSETRRERKQRLYNISGLIGSIGTIVFGILSIWLVVDPSLGEAIRRALGLAS
jgi:hypothetical protein